MIWSGLGQSDECYQTVCVHCVNTLHLVAQNVLLDCWFCVFAATNSCYRVLLTSLECCSVRSFHHDAIMWFHTSVWIRACAEACKWKWKGRQGSDKEVCEETRQQAAPQSKKRKLSRGCQRTEQRNERRKRDCCFKWKLRMTAAAGPLRTSSDRSCPETQDRTPSVIKSSQVGCEISKRWADCIPPSTWRHLLLPHTRSPVSICFRLKPADSNTGKHHHFHKQVPRKKVLQALCICKGFTFTPAALKTLKPTSIHQQKLNPAQSHTTQQLPTYTAFTRFFPCSSSFHVVTCGKLSKYCTSSTSPCHLLQG